MSEQQDPKRATVVAGVFAEAVGLGEAERAALLSGRCGGDQELKGVVQFLLDAYDCGYPTVTDDLLPKGAMEAIAGRGNVADGPPRTRPSTTDAPPPGHIGRYKLLQPIGEGGFGTVFMAEQLHPVRRRVALKVVKPGMDTKQVIARFEAERQALAMMDHPNIAKVLDAGATDAGRPYFVMELVKGTPITQYCDDNKLDTKARLELFTQVCRAVQHAHQKAVIHRDIKPSNVLVTVQEDGRPVPKIIDFGIAKATQAKLTEKTLFTDFRHFIGTPEYMSPEQADANAMDVDTRTDVYSLGVLLYELLTGTTPFDPKTLRSKGYGEIQRIIREVDPPRPSTRLSTLSAEEIQAIARRRHTEPKKLSRLVRRDLDWVVMRCLEKDRTRRYGSADDLANDLTRHLAAQPVSAGPPSAVYRLRKFVRRNRLGTAAVAAVAVLVSLLVAVMSRGLVRDHRQREQHAKLQEEHIRALQSEQRRTLEQMADGLVAQGDALLAAGRWGECKARYSEAADVYARLGNQALPAELGLCKALAHAPASLATFAPATPLSCVTFFPDARRLLCGHYDGSISVYEAPTGRAMRVFVPSRPPPPIQEDRLRPDGTFVSQRNDPTVTDLAITADGKFAVSGNACGLVTVWDLASGREIRRLESDARAIHAVALWEEGRFVAAAAEVPPDDGRVKTVLIVWDLVSGERFEVPGSKSNQMKGLAVSLDGSLAIAAGEFGVRSWHAQGRLGLGADTGRNMDLRIGNCLALALSNDAHFAAVAGTDGLALVRIDDGRVAHRFGGYGMRGRRVQAVAFSPSGRHVITGSDDFTVRLWAADTGNEVRVFTEHQSAVRRVAVDPSGRVAVSSSDDGTVKLWALPANDIAGSIRESFANTISASFCLNGRCVAAGGPDGTLRMIDVASGRTLLMLRSDTSRRPVKFRPQPWQKCRSESPDADTRTTDLGTTSIGLLPGSQQALFIGHDGTFERWDIPSARLLHSFVAPSYCVGAAAISLDGRHVLTTPSPCSPDLRVKKWDLETGTEVWAVGGAEVIDVTALAFSPDATHAVALASGQNFHWSESGICLDKFGAFAAVYQHDAGNSSALCEMERCVAFSNDGRSFFTGSEAGTVRKWDYTEPLRKGRLVRAASSPVRSLTFSPDGSLIGVGHEDGSVVLLHVKAGKEFDRLLTHSSHVSRVAFSPDGKSLCSVGSDGLRVSEFARARSLWTLLPRVQQATRELAMGRAAPPDVAAVGEWYAAQGLCSWGAELLEDARSHGVAVSSITIAHCYWDAGDVIAARREFNRAAARNEAPREYLDLCVNALAHHE